MKTAQKKDSDVTKKNPKSGEETEDFIFEDIRFQETENGKVRCGVCEIECTKLIAHMNRNKYCTEYFSNMHMFKMEYSNFRHNISRKKNDGNGRSVDQGGSKKSYGEIIENNRTIPPNPITKSIPTPKDEKPEPVQKDLENDSFKFGGFEFKEMGKDKIMCGVCQIECIRLIVHMNGSLNCAKHFCMPDFKTKYSRYRHNKRVKKHETSQKAENPKEFKENVSKRKHKQETRQKKGRSYRFQGKS